MVGLTRLASIDSSKDAKPDPFLRLDLEAPPFKPFFKGQNIEISLENKTKSDGVKRVKSENPEDMMCEASYTVKEE